MNPEAQFHVLIPDYSGMNVTVIPYLFTPQGEKAQTFLMDILTPDGCRHEGPRPLVMFLHGGGFKPPCNRRQTYVSLFAADLLAVGFSVAAPDYPICDTEEEAEKIGEHAAAMRAGDAVHAALELLKDKAENFDLDVSRPVLMGGSAGGWTAFAAAERHPGDWNVLVNLWGPPKWLPDVSHFPPVFSVQGTEDQLIPFAWENPLQTALEKAGIAHELYSLPGAGHTPIAQRKEYMPLILKFIKQQMM